MVISVSSCVKNILNTSELRNNFSFFLWAKITYNWDRGASGELAVQWFWQPRGPKPDGGLPLAHPRLGHPWNSFPLYSLIKESTAPEPWGPPGPFGCSPEDIVRPHDSRSPFHRKMYIHLQVRCHTCPIWPLLAVNVTYILIVSEGFWRWCIAHGMSGFLDCRPVFQGAHDVSETGSVFGLRWKKGPVVEISSF
jgi:hypothetical protein